MHIVFHLLDTAAQSGAHSKMNAALNWDPLSNGARPTTHSKRVQNALTTRQLYEGENTYHISSIRHRSQIVAAQSKTPNENDAALK